MKKIFLLLSISLFLSSCLKEDKNLFDLNASARMTKYLEETDEILKGSQHGWIMEYYPGIASGSREWGGYTLLLKFENDDKVTFRSLYGATRKDTTLSSMYQLIPETGPVLSFNTHNPLIHYFCDPDQSAYPPADRIGPNNGTRMGGDYEFIVLEKTPQKVVLKGKKHQNIITMKPLSSAEAWDTHLAHTLVWENALLWKYTPYLYIDGDNDQLFLRGTANNFGLRRLVYTYDSAGIVLNRSMAFVSDPTGITLYSPLRLFGQDITRMEPDTVRGTFKAPGQSGELFALPSKSLPDFIFPEGNWYFDHQQMGSVGQEAWSKLKINDGTLTLPYAYLSTNVGSAGFAVCIRFVIISSGAGYNCIWPCTGYTPTGSTNQVRMAITQQPIPSPPGTNGEYLRTRQGQAAIDALGGAGGLKRYELTNIGEGKIKLQDINNKDNWYILVNTEVPLFN